MKRASIAFCGLLSLGGAGASSVLAAAADGTLPIEAPTTLRQIARQYFPESGSVRARFIRKVAAANPAVFSSQAAAFDQPLSPGLSLKLPAGTSLKAALPATESLAEPAPAAMTPVAPMPAPAVIAAPTPVKGIRLALPARQEDADEKGVQRISMKSFAAMIAKADEMVAAQRVEEDIAAQSVRGASAIYEPFAFVALERERWHTLNNAMEKLQRSGTNPGDVFDQFESRAKTGLMFKASTGADVELSYNVMQTWNSLQPKAGSPTPENKGYLGFKVTQPLLRGAGEAATSAGIYIAETEKGVAKESVRQVLASRLMEALSAYIFVQRAEERVRLRRQALQVAAEIELEMSTQHDAGLRSASELTEARSSLALRRAQLAQAEQDLAEQRNTLQVFISAGKRDPGEPLRQTRLLPADSLQIAETGRAEVRKPALPDDGDFSSLDEAISRRPELRVADWKIERESRKLDAAKDQTLPELNIVLRAGQDDLSASYRRLNQYNDVNYYTWMAGMTFKIGLFGDEKKVSEYDAARLRKHQAELAKGAVRQRVANEMYASSSVLDFAMRQVERQNEIVQAQRNLLQAETELVVEGKRSRLDLLKKQLELLLAEESLADSTAQANRASYLASQVDGTLLSRLGLE